MGGVFAPVWRLALCFTLTLGCSLSTACLALCLSSVLRLHLQGEDVRQYTWVPGQNALPPTVQALVDTGAASGVSAVPYIYPILGFTRPASLGGNPWLYPRGGGGALWWSRGKICCRRLCFRYAQQHPLVLQESSTRRWPTVSSRTTSSPLSSPSDARPARGAQAMVGVNPTVRSCVPW